MSHPPTRNPTMEAKKTSTMRLANKGQRRNLPMAWLRREKNLEKKEKQIEELTIKENETKKKYEKMMTDIKDRIKALQMGQETV